MSEARLELVEECEHGERNNCGVGPHCLECSGTESCFNGMPLHRWCPGGSRRVLSVPTVEMVEAALDAFYDPPPGSVFVTERMSAALAAAFNTLGIQEKTDPTLNK